MGIKQYSFKLKEETKNDVFFYGEYQKREKKIHFLEVLSKSDKSQNHFILSTYSEVTYENLLNEYKKVKSE